MRQQRFVIRSATGAFFTEFKVLATRPVTLNGVLLGHEQDLEPKFDGQTTRQAAKFDTQLDAEEQIKNPVMFHGGPEAFAGCTVEPTDD